MSTYHGYAIVDAKKRIVGRFRGFDLEIKPNLTGVPTLMHQSADMYVKDFDYWAKAKAEVHYQSYPTSVNIFTLWEAWFLEEELVGLWEYSGVMFIQKPDKRIQFLYDTRRVLLTSCTGDLKALPIESMMDLSQQDFCDQFQQVQDYVDEKITVPTYRVWLDPEMQTQSFISTLPDLEVTADSVGTEHGSGMVIRFHAFMTLTEYKALPDWSGP